MPSLDVWHLHRVGVWCTRPSGPDNLSLELNRKLAPVPEIRLCSRSLLEVINSGRWHPAVILYNGTVIRL